MTQQRDNPLAVALMAGGSEASTSAPFPAGDPTTKSTVAPGTAPTYATAIAIKYSASPSAWADGQTGTPLAGPRGQGMMTIVDANAQVIDQTLPVGVMGRGGHTSSATHTHGSDTTAYSINDVVGVDTSSAVLTFDSIAPSAGGDVILEGFELRIDLASVPAGQTSFSLALYSSTPPSALADNAAWDLPSGDRSVFLGKFSLGTPVDLGSTLYVRLDGLSYRLSATGAALYGYLITDTAFTPAAGTVRVVKIHSRDV